MNNNLREVVRTVDSRGYIYIYVIDRTLHTEERYIYTKKPPLAPTRSSGIVPLASRNTWRRGAGAPLQYTYN